MWAVEQDIVRGCDPDRFCPRALVTRGEVASILVRALSLPPAIGDYFDDDAATVHEGAINSMAEAGIANGCADRRFCPSGAVTRAQMASFLTGGLRLPAVRDEFFTDAIGTTHADAINSVAAAGITGGCALQRYCPSTSVSREQMAALLRRSQVPALRLGQPATLAECAASLQRRVNSASAGSTLNVPACAFRETVHVTKALTIRTVGAVVYGQRQRQHAFVITADHVTIDGFGVQGTTNRAQDGAIRVRDSSRFTLRNAHIHDTGGACVSIAGGSGHRVLDSELAYCAQQGYHITAVHNSLVARNRIHHNNPNRQYDPGWEAGGGKATVVRGLTFDANRVYSNRGPGLWCDVDCRDVVYKDNRVRNNTGPGILFETGDGATITNNRIFRNGFGFPAWGWGGGIVLSSSADAEVFGNIVAWNADGISVISQARGDNPGARDHYVHDNVIVISPKSTDRSDKFMLAWQQDHAGGIYSRSSNNRGANNRYWHAQAEPTWARFEWSGPKSTLAAFNATRGERNGRYLSTAEKNTVLSNAGMPTSP